MPVRGIQREMVLAVGVASGSGELAAVLSERGVESSRSGLETA